MYNFLLSSFPAPTDIESGAEDEAVPMIVDSQSDGEGLMDDWITMNWPVPNARANGAGPGPGQVLIDLPQNIAFPSFIFFKIQLCFSIYLGKTWKTFRNVHILPYKMYLTFIIYFQQLVRPSENLEDVASAACLVCITSFENLMAFNDCTHMVCYTCFKNVERCPMCNTPRGRARGKQVNISNLLIVRRTDVESDFGLSPQVRAASQASGRRPADRTPAKFAAEADQDAIRQAQRADSDDEPSSQDFVAPIMEILQNCFHARLI